MCSLSIGVRQARLFGAFFFFFNSLRYSASTSFVHRLSDNSMQQQLAAVGKCPLEFADTSALSKLKTQYFSLFTYLLRSPFFDDYCRSEVFL